MSATNATPTISLPLFIGTDKPAWLTDWNGAMNTIDGAIATLQTAEGGTATALASLSQSVEALSGTVSQHTTSLQTITTAVAGNTGSINTINSLIGNGQPTTEDKTIIGAINEIYGEIGGGDGVDADEVNYDNASSGLTATDVQAAIDEVNAKIPQGGSVDADDVSYDNTQSGLTATNVQGAIDEIALGGITFEKIAEVASPTTSLTTYQLDSGKKFSDYTMIWVGVGVAGSSTQLRCSAILPVNVGTYFYNISATQGEAGEFMPASDTSFQAYTSNSTAQAPLLVYGIK